MTLNFEQWLHEHAAGQYLLQCENDFFENTAKDIFGQISVQLGMSHINAINYCTTSRKITAGTEKQANIYCDIRQLPFSAEILDGIILPHTLDFCQHPQQILHEVFRTLRPEGKLIITGINPYNLWTLNQHHQNQALPPRQCCIRLKRLKDWLDLLGFDICFEQFMLNTPAINNTSWINKIKSLEQITNKYTPQFAVAYGLFAIKRVYSGHRLHKHTPLTTKLLNNSVLTPAKVRTSK